MSTCPSRSGCSGVPSNWLRTVIKCGRRPHAADRGLQRLWRPIDHPGERSPDRRVSPVSERCPAPRDHAPRPRTRPGTRQQQHTGITVTDIGFSSRRLRQPAHDRFRHAAGAITAAREPHRVVTLVVGDVEKGLCARFVIAGEMSVRREALRMKKISGVRSGYSDLANAGTFSATSGAMREAGATADPAILFAHTNAQPALHLNGNPSRFRQCPNLEITFSAASAVVA